MRRSAHVLIAMLAAAAAIASCDPVHSDAVDALGGEAPGVRRGPLHRPGQPCLVCHDGKVGDPQQFSVAGTVFLRPSAPEPAVGAMVTLTSANGATFTAQTNQAGNFYVLPSEYDPVFPMQAAIEAEGRAVTMQTEIGRDGSCGGCHVDPAGPASPGHVSVTLDDGGAPL
jgi:hypothetical protein